MMSDDSKTQRKGLGETPCFRKMDRYKASNLQAFNVRRPHRYDSSLWVRFWTSQWDWEVLFELPDDISSLRILDVGCATGRLLKTLARAGAQHLAGTDLAPRILSVARRKLCESRITADLRVADAEDTLPWPNSSFDVVIMTGVLHHFYRPIEATKEIHRVLQNEGHLLVIEPWLPLPLRLVVNLGLRFIPREGDCYYYTPSEVIRIFTLLGFTNFRYRRVAGHSFMIVCSKQH